MTVPIRRSTPESGTNAQRSHQLSGYHIRSRNSHLCEACDLTQPPPAHVVELRAEEERGQDVDDREDDPEHHVSFPKHLQTSATLTSGLRIYSTEVKRCDTHHPQHGEEDDHGQAGVGGVSTGVDVWVSLLIQLQHAQPSNHVHERGVCSETSTRGR